MAGIPPKLRKELSEDPYMQRCIHLMREDHTCKGRLTFEHAWLYGKSQVNSRWAIVPCCASTNIDATGETKNYNRWIALKRAEELGVDLPTEYPRKDWTQERIKLDNMFEAPTA